MTEKEAYKILSDGIDTEKMTIQGDADYIAKYFKAELIAVKAFEKQIPKKPNIYGDGFYDGEPVYDTWECPNCGTAYEIGYDRHKYCPNCGQAIDLSEVEE